MTIELDPGVSFQPGVLTSRDGTQVLQLRALEGMEPHPHRSAFSLIVRAGTEPGGPDARVAVNFANSFPADFSAYGLRGHKASQQNLIEFAVAAIGEALDAGPLALDFGERGKLLDVECDTAVTSSWQERPKATDEQILEYICRHLYAGWRFGD